MVPVLQVDHRVRDYETWKAAFDGDPVGREAGGVRRHRIARLADDPNHVLIELEFDTAEEANAFHARLEELWASVGERLGLESPSARVVDVVETIAY
jgi:hypothetical protein